MITSLVRSDRAVIERRRIETAGSNDGKRTTSTEIMIGKIEGATQTDRQHAWPSLRIETQIAAADSRALRTGGKAQTTIGTEAATQEGMTGVTHPG